MGGGASIEIRHTHTSFMHVTDVHFQELLSSKSAREQLFQDIAKYPVDGKTDKSQLVSLTKLVAYFTDNSNSLYPGFHVNVDTLNAAFKYTVRKFKERQSQKRNKPIPKAARLRMQADPQLSKAMVHSFLPTLLLFMRVWDIFDAADKLVVEDQRVFKGEFMRIKEKLNNVHGIVIFGETSDEHWEKEFEALDRNHDRFITFEEMCSYALDHIKRPFDYKPSDEDEILDEFDEDEEEDEDSAVGGDVVFVEVVAHSLTTKDPPTPTEDPNSPPLLESISAVDLPAVDGVEESPHATQDPQEQAVTEEAAAKAPEPAKEQIATPSGKLLFV